MVEYTYDSYGNRIKTIDASNYNLSAINSFRYRSYYYDNETGWYYLNRRYYNPVIGRFITMDSVEYLGASGTALSMNLFSYCENNPVNFIDNNGTLRINVKWVGITVDLIIWLIPALYGVAKVWSTISKSSNKLVKFGDKLIKYGKKLFKMLDDRLYCFFAKSSTYALVKTIGILAGFIFVISSIGEIVEYIIDILDGKWDGYLDTSNFKPKLDFTRDY